MIHVKALKFRSDENIGLYGFATDKFCLVGNQASEEEKKHLEQILKVPVHTISICGTPLIGVFLVGDENTLFVPSIVLDREKQILQELAVNYEFDIVFVDTAFTALGNIMIYEDKKMFVNEELEEEVIKHLLQEVASLQIERISIADTDVVGSSVVKTKKGMLVHPHISDNIADKLEEAYARKLTLGTVNYGSVYVRSGVIANSFGFVIGATSSGPEITNADEAFGFLENE